jgi:hypothetical protein
VDILDQKVMDTHAEILGLMVLHDRFVGKGRSQKLIINEHKC